MTTMTRMVTPMVEDVRLCVEDLLPVACALLAGNPNDAVGRELLLRRQAAIAAGSDPYVSLDVPMMHRDADRVWAAMDNIYRAMRDLHVTP